MHKQNKEERERILNVISDFCWAHETNDYMLGKGCANCPIQDCGVCNDDRWKHIVPLSKLKQAEKIILEVLGKEQNNDT